MPLEQTPPEASGQQKYRFLVNGEVHRTDDPLIDGRAIRRKAGADPASEHVVIQVTHPGSRSIGLDETVDLSPEGREEFRTFLSDRTFNLTIDEVGYEWGARKISAADIRDIAGIPQNRALFLERSDDPDELIADDGEIDLSERGAERVRSGRRLITVYYGGDDQPFEIERGAYTGTRLAALFGVPSGHVLDLVKASGEFDEIEPDETLRVKDGMHFVSHPPYGQSS